MEISYKGFVAELNFFADASAFCGEVLYVRDVISIQAPTIEEAIRALQEIIDQYLSYCSKT
jgi:predicted HicB family RNase H-like nuclease